MSDAERELEARQQELDAEEQAAVEELLARPMPFQDEPEPEPEEPAEAEADEDSAEEGADIALDGWTFDKELEAAEDEIGKQGALPDTYGAPGNALTFPDEVGDEEDDLSFALAEQDVAVRQLEDRVDDLETIERNRMVPDDRPRFYGMPAEAYTSGATINLDPCDVGGTDNGLANVTVQAGWTLPANTTIAVTTIIPFELGDDGETYYAVCQYPAGGTPPEVVTNIQYDTTTHKLQKKVRGDFGTFCTTESSAWVDITTAVDCTT